MDTQEHRRSLYKEQKEMLTPNQHIRLNRQLQEANRNKKRQELFHCTRNISPNPAPQTATNDKENHYVEPHEAGRPIKCEDTVGTTRTAKLICTARDPEKIRKQEAFILRYLDWRDKKKAKQEKKNEVNKKPCFVSAVGKEPGFGGKIALSTKGEAAGITSNNHHHPTFVPKGHNEFQPPPDLKFPKEEEIKEKIKSRQSIYTIVPTPPKKKKSSNEVLIAKKPLPSNVHFSISSNKKKTPARSNFDMTNDKQSKPKSIGPKTRSQDGPTTSSTSKTTTNFVIKTSISKPKNLVKTFNRVNSEEKNNPTTTTTTTTITTTTTTTSAYKPRPLKMPPPSTMPAKGKTLSTKIRKSQTVPQKPAASQRAKFKTQQTKTTAAAKGLESNKPLNLRQNGRNSPHQKTHKNARLTQTMKAKKPLKPTNTGTASAKLVSLMVNEINDHYTAIQTPRDFSDSNHFDEFVTSTKVKNSNQTSEEINGVSPIHTVPKRSSTSAKRNLLIETTMKMAESQLGTVIEKKKGEEMNDTQEIKKNTRFNFIRYSEINASICDDDAAADGNGIQEVKKSPQLEESRKDVNGTLLANKSLEDEKTPTKQTAIEDDKPVNYLSPYVSVSRGKVSLQMEKVKRNSMYLASPTSGVAPLDDLVDKDSTVVISPESPQLSMEVRRTLEAVRYYRNQLQNEIDRLHQQCNIWETYKDENIALLKEANVDDMIDAAVGQTRLLTSKKFMQFKGLIDRCESGATGIGQRPYDGSESTKFISSTDLEGFWSMLGLQVDNLEKRFENLNRWKNNNWQDPEEEVKIKANKPKRLSKVKKKSTGSAVAKAKPNTALQQMLRKMQSEMRSKKANDMQAATDDVVIVTPSRVKDRKYFSPAATVVGIPVLCRKNSQDSPNRRVSIGGGRRKSHESPRNMKATAVGIVEKSTEATPRRATLHETVMRSNAEAAQMAFNSPKIQARKSILKTPGSARTNLRNVMFNQKCRVKKFKFILNDEGEHDAVDDNVECNESTEEDMKQNTQESDEETENPSCGTYSLRNRKVRLRPSCEIVIPK